MNFERNNRQKKTIKVNFLEGVDCSLVFFRASPEKLFKILKIFVLKKFKVGLSKDYKK